MINRPKKGNSKGRVAGVSLGNTRLAWRTVQGYISAITDLWSHQVSMHQNHHPTPRGKTVLTLINNLKKQDHQRKREQFEDKGNDTLLDGYDEEDMLAICNALWSQSVQPEKHLRTLVDFLAGHYFLCRGDNRRVAELSDLMTLELKDEGTTQCLPLILTMRQGKTNQHGRLETMGAFRTKENPQTCILSALAFYLLMRWFVYLH